VERLLSAIGIDVRKRSLLPAPVAEALGYTKKLSWVSLDLPLILSTLTEGFVGYVHQGVSVWQMGALPAGLPHRVRLLCVGDSDPDLVRAIWLHDHDVPAVEDREHRSIGRPADRA
jgi:hypothetical protein